jgi:glyoxylase I family protein
MLGKPRVGAIVFYVKDLARAKQFYGETLGLKTTINPGHDDEGYDDAKHEWMLAEAENASLIFFVRSEPVGRTPIVVFSLTGGIDDVVEKLARRGVQIITPVSEAPGGWTADFLDPDGHVLSFYQRGERGTKA